MTILGQEKPALVDRLAHFGIKGMQWGVRRQNRSLNKASRARDREAVKKLRSDDDRAIDAARARVSSGQTRQALKTAKKQFKVDKRVIGSREARKKLNVARIKSQNDRETAQMLKSGAETAGTIIGLIGGVAVSGLVAGAVADRNRRL